MKTSFLKFTLTLVVVCFSAISFAQEFQGKAYYQSKTTMDLGEWGGREMSPEQRKRIEDRMKSFLEKEYVLTFNKTESIYKEEEKLEAPGAGGRGWGGFGSMDGGGPQYKNVQTKQLLQNQEFFGKQFLIKDDLKNLEWKMGTETKQIGQYTCFKATATKPLDKTDFMNMRRRGGDDDKKEERKKDSSDANTSKVDGTESDNPMDQVEIPESIEVVAWYTPQIPVNQGPDDYWGLPGLILEVKADRTIILCTKIVLNPEVKDSIDKPEKGEEVTQAEYTAIITKKMEEMREMYGGRNRGGRRN
ncbi:MAG: GLPGLI family protein [Winogradskyella sp.]|uniref:GLPGLI family protein n=1 Tax=Winogradskyella sp. TaxID=1883156 RepID=UPI0017DD1385|nr:GLPGLI family protein [Winogradskyella sp.]